MGPGPCGVRRPVPDDLTHVRSLAKQALTVHTGEVSLYCVTPGAGEPSPDPLRVLDTLAEWLPVDAPAPVGEAAPPGGRAPAR